MDISSIAAAAITSSVSGAVRGVSYRVVDKFLVPIFQITSDTIMSRANKLHSNLNLLDHESSVTAVIFCSVSAVVSGLSAYVYYQYKSTKEETRIQEQQLQKYAMPAELQGSPYKREMDVAIELAVECGNRMYQYYETSDFDNDFTLGSDTKFDPEDFYAGLVDSLLQEFPTHAIAGEGEGNSGHSFSVRSGGPTWVIDPIDGTPNSTLALPLACISIGHYVDGVPVLGVVYAPMTAELYVGVSGYGSYCNGVQVLKQADFTCANKRSLVAELHYLIYDATKDTNNLLEI
jgi:Inositol monophosphatase family